MDVSAAYAGTANPRLTSLSQIHDMIAAVASAG
jgi:hypothetical protein